MIRTGILANFVNTIERLGGSIEQVLEKSGVKREQIWRADSFITYRSYLSLLDSAAKLTRCPHFGLEMTRELGPENLGLLGFVMCQSRTVGDAFSSLAHFYHVHDTSGSVSFTLREQMAIARYETPSYDQPGGRPAIDVAAGMAANILRTLVGESFVSERVTFPYPEPENLVPHQFLQTRELLFNEPGCGTSTYFFGEHVQQIVPQTDPQLRIILGQYLATMEAGDQQSCSRQVEELIRRFLPTGVCTIGTVARFMSLSIRNLQSRLQQEQTTFQSLLERVRKSLALQYLVKGEVSLTEIAQLLGYSELSAFSRSFRRWYGCSPRQWLCDSTLAYRSADEASADMTSTRKHS